MLDVHATLTTPGAGAVLGNPGAIAVNDGAQVAGVPLTPAGTLRMWGFNSPTADTINAIRLQSQDMVDPINGITVNLAAASVLCQYFDYTTLPYKTGARNVQVGTNTGVVAGTGFLIDEYKGRGTVRQCRPSDGGEVMFGGITFGGALTANQWSSQAVAPTTAIPNGKYAILGAFVTALTNVALIRFSHADFQGLKPGFPVRDSELALATAQQVAMRDGLVMTRDGEQFIAMGELLGSPQCPVFSVSNAGTGLTVEAIAAQACTPVVNVVLMKVG
jgi:hypothetical protein